MLLNLRFNFYRRSMAMLFAFCIFSFSALGFAQEVQPVIPGSVPVPSDIALPPPSEPQAANPVVEAVTTTTTVTTEAVEVPVPEESVPSPEIADTASGPQIIAEDAGIPEPEVKDLLATGQSPSPDPGEPIAATEIDPVVPALPVGEDVDENLFFDADALVPQGEMGQKGGPRKVNPALEPASKLIVVEKNYEAGSQQAQLVAAQRAVTLGRYDAALVLYDKMYQQNKRDPNALMGRASALQHLGRNEEAIETYEALLEMRPENVEAQINMLGLLGQRYPAVALRRLMDLSEKSPENPGIAAQIANVNAEMGNYNEALQYLGIRSMEPQNAAHLFNMAVIADRAGAKKEAVDYYEQSLELDTIYGGGKSVPRDSIYERLAQLR